MRRAKPQWEESMCGLHYIFVLTQMEQKNEETCDV